MNINYTDPEEGIDMRDRTRSFMEEVVIPTERDLPSGEPVSAKTVEELQKTAREYGVYGPQLPEAYGGHGLDTRAMLPVFEEAGRSLLGPVSLRIEAPDEGNMHLLKLAGTDRQKEQWLCPLARGEMRSAFAMTEPTDGGGSDPKMLKTTANKDGDEWVIDGHKWWTTQATAADLLIVMARTDQEAHPYGGTSMFLVDPDQQGVEIVRNIPHLQDSMIPMTHGELIFDGVRVPEENILGEVNQGFTLAQRRLGPARLTHCMRYSGMATRALDVAKAYVSEREAFGDPLSEKQALRHDIADAEMWLHAVRTMVRHAAGQIAAGEQARVEAAMCKVYAANVCQETIDTALQMCGGHGIGRDLPIADFYENVRAFRIVDGPDEVHRRTIARAALQDVTKTEIADIPQFGDPGPRG